MQKNYVWNLIKIDNNVNARLQTNFLKLYFAISNHNFVG